LGEPVKFYLTLKVR